MILPGFVALCKTSPALAGFLEDRIYEDELPRGFSYPAVVVHVYNGLQDGDLQGPVAVREDMLQFDTYGATPSEKRLVAETLRTVVENFIGTLPNGSVVQLAEVQREMDLPAQSNSAQKGNAYRRMLGLRVVSLR